MASWHSPRSCSPCSRPSPPSPEPSPGNLWCMANSRRRVLLLAADQFEDMELLYPLYRLAEDDIAVTVAGLDDKPVTGKKGHGPVPVDTTVSEVSEADFDALVIPGGYSPTNPPPSPHMLVLVLPLTLP